MTASGKRLAVFLSVPRERMSSLIGAAERLLSLELYATPLHYRRGLVKSIHLGTEPEPTGKTELAWPLIKVFRGDGSVTSSLRYIDLTETTATYRIFSLAALTSSCSANRVLRVSAQI